MKNYMIPLAFLLLFAAGCNWMTGKHDYEQTQAAFVPDSLWTPTGNAQLDSLLQLAAVAPQDTTLAELYSKIGDIYKNIDFEKAKEYYLKLRNLSEQLDWNNGRYIYAVDFSNMLIREGFPDSAIVLLQKAHELAVRENDELWKTNMLINTGNAYFMKDWYEMALSCYMEGLTFLERENNPQKLQTVYYMMCQLYRYLNDMDKAIEYGEKSLALNPENPTALLTLGIAHQYIHQYEKAESYYEEVTRICELQNNIYLLGANYLQLGQIALYRYDMEKAEKYALQSMEINRQFGDAYCCSGIIMLSKLEQLKGNYGKSEKYAKEALQIATEYESLEWKKHCYMILAELATVRRNYREYIQYWEEYDLAEKAIALETSIRASEEMSAKYETEKKELEIERQQHIISRQNMQRWLLVAGIMVCAVILVLLWNMLRLRNRRNLALAEMNATKDKFFSIISHDLKNPALAQRDALQLLIKNAHSWNIDTLTEYYHELLKSADGQVELLYNLLNWAQIQTGRMAYTPVAFNLATRLRADISLIRKMSENKGITFIVQMPDDVLVTGDGNMLATVVRNLLTNAVKFTAEGGQINLDISPCDTGYAVSVADTGIGFDSRDVARNVSTTRRGTAGEQASGLGLIVCKELLEKHGSVLQVESKEGEGSRFWFGI